MTINIDQDVLWFYISVYDIQVMEVFQPKEQLCEIKLCLFFCEFLDFAQMEKHFSSSAEIHNKKQLGLGLK